ncbi:MAG: PH domain-containing protein [bacterium]|nr:PH domain-containing protein [bacterium]
MNNEAYSFRGQRSDETVALVTKQHIWLLMPILLVWLVIIAVVAVALLGFGASKITSIVIVATLIVGALYSFYFWFMWNGCDYIVTNQRVIKIDQVSLFGRVISEAEIHRIQEISTEIKGPIRTMLNFGTVVIKTASDDSKIDLEDVTSPYDVQQAIVQIQKQSLQPERSPRQV